MVKINRELIKGSAILLIFFNLYSVINFVFQASMARFLSIADYGVLITLFYVIWILNILGESIQTIFAKQAAIEKNDGKIKNLVKRSTKKIFRSSLLFFFVYLILAMPLYLIKEIPYTLIAINGFFIFAYLILPINRGVMQGKKQFSKLSLNLFVESGTKVAFSALFIWIIWLLYGKISIYGAIIGTLGGALITLYISRKQIKSVLNAKEITAETLEIKKDSKSVFLIMFALSAFFTIDVFIAQLVFSKEIAGLYAVASIISKAIFWGTQPIGKAMFPISTEERLDKNYKKNDHTHYNAILLLGLMIVFALALFFFFPNLIIKIFSGKDLLESAQILFYLGLSTSLLSFANINILYNLSKNRSKNPSYYLIFLAIGILLLFIFNNSLVEFSLAFLTASAIFLLGSIILSTE